VKNTNNSKTYSITLKVQEADFISTTPEDLEYYLQDLLTKSVLPALNLSLVPLTLTVKRARN
jgi:hypothetical protein